jgi:uncharacterized protein (DUF1015 family)
MPRGAALLNRTHDLSGRVREQIDRLRLLPMAVVVLPPVAGIKWRYTASLWIPPSMLRIRPFHALRPPRSLAPRVSSPPYDVISTTQARDLAADLPESFLHVIRPEIDLPVGTDPYCDAVYEMARKCLDRMRNEGWLVQDETPRLFLYRQVIGDQQQTGLVCCCHVDDYNQGRIKKHELTRQDKEDDRTRHLLTLGAHPGPVFLTFREEPTLTTLIEQGKNSDPVAHFVAPDGVTHTAWAIDDPQPFIDACGRLDGAYVADGHHRTASAARAAATRRDANADHTGDESYNWFLTVLFPADDLTILPYNRVVSDLGDHDAASFVEALKMIGSVSVTTEPIPESPGTRCFYLDGVWHRLEIDPSEIDADDPIASLDVSLLQHLVLEKILGIADPTTDPRLGFVGGVHGCRELKDRVDCGKAALGISMYPTSITQLLDVSDAGKIMPPKSTWFEPKLRSGLFVHAFD